MTDKIAFWTAIANGVSAAVAAIGLPILIVTLKHLGKQASEAKRMAEMSLRIARNEFFLRLQDRNDTFVSINMRLKGSISGKNLSYPETDVEWTEVATYMGHLETIQCLVQDGILTVNDIDKYYSHRIYSVVKHDAIRKRFLEDNACTWADFIDLWNSVANKPVYCHIAGGDGTSLAKYYLNLIHPTNDGIPQVGTKTG